MSPGRQLGAPQTPVRGYEMAIRMARGGASVEEIAESCGTTRAEARLLRRLHNEPPMQLAKGGFQLSFISTFTTLAMPMDAALQQIKIECFFPADDATAAKARQLAL